MSAIEVKRFDDGRSDVYWRKPVAKITQRDEDAGFSFDHYLIASSVEGDYGDFSDAYNFRVLSILFREDQYQAHRFSTVMTRNQTDKDFVFMTIGEIEICMLPYVNAMGMAMEIAVHSSPGIDNIHDNLEAEQDQHTNSIAMIRVELDSDGRWIADAIYGTVNGSSTEERDVKFAANNSTVYSFRPNIMHAATRPITNQLNAFASGQPGQLWIRTYYSILSPLRSTYLEISGKPCMIGFYSQAGAQVYGRMRYKETKAHFTNHSECLSVFSIFYATSRIRMDLRLKLRSEFTKNLPTRRTGSDDYKYFQMATITIAHLMPTTYIEQSGRFITTGNFEVKAYPRTDGRTDVFMYQYSDETDHDSKPLRVFHYILSSRNVLAPQYAMTIDSMIYSDLHDSIDWAPMLAPYEELVYRRYGVDNGESIDLHRMYRAMSPFPVRGTAHRNKVRSLMSWFDDLAAARARALMGDFDMWRAGSAYFGDKIFYGIKRNAEENAWTLCVSDGMSPEISAEAFLPEDPGDSLADAYAMNTDIMHASSSALVSWISNIEMNELGTVNIYVMSRNKQNDVWKRRHVDFETVYAPMITATEKCEAHE